MKKNNLVTISLILTILAIFSLGCGMLKSNLVSEKSDPRETYLNAVKKLKEAKFFHAVGKFERKESGSTTVKTEDENFYIAPDKFHKIHKTSYTDSASDTSVEWFVIGSDVYAAEEKDKRIMENGTFTKEPNSERSEGWQFNQLSLVYRLFQDMDYLSGKLGKVTFVGKQTINGIEALKFSFFFKEAFHTISVNPANGLLVAVEENDDNSKDLITFDFDKEPKIEVPTKVK